MILLAIIAVIPLVSACSQNKQQASKGSRPAWSANFDSIGISLQQIHRDYMQDSTRMSPQARMIYHNMRSLWAQMSNVRTQMMQNGGMNKGRGMMGNGGMMNGRGMMRGNGTGQGMMGRGSMMRFNEMNQQMLSYCQGMRQMMQKNNPGMASMYGHMANRMQSLLTELPKDTTAAPASSEGSVAVPDGSVIFASNCASCHGADGAGVSGVFPPLNGSSVVTGDKETLTKILLDGLQGTVAVAGGHYNGMMPAFGNTFSDAQIAAVLTYVRSLPDNKAGNISTGDVQNVRKETKSRRQAWTPGELGLK
ncbi:MAG TPA: cytochrome c [Balneolales bacterium]|nr:cytochrome c [Balneolales bacterium]